MVIVMEPRVSEEKIQAVIDMLTRRGFDAHRSTGNTRTVSINWRTIRPWQRLGRKWTYGSRPPPTSTPP